MAHIEDLRFYFSLEECCIDLKTGKFSLDFFYHEKPSDIQKEAKRNCFVSAIISLKDFYFFSAKRENVNE